MPAVYLLKKFRSSKSLLDDLTVLPSVTPVKAVGIDGGYSLLTGAVKEIPFIVLMPILLLHVTFLNLQSLPQ